MHRIIGFRILGKGFFLLRQLCKDRLSAVLAVRRALYSMDREWILVTFDPWGGNYPATLSVFL